MKNFLFLFVAALTLTSCSNSTQPKTIYIVRHAEKMLVEDKDPELAQVGYVRAKKLAQILEDDNIQHVFSTDYKRTRLTAQPTAEAAGLEIESYDPSNQEDFAKQLQSLKGNILVVGHSNTVSKLANYFVGEGEKFADLEDVEYDFIYEVNIDKNGMTVTRKLYKDF